jgi:hypothetical protein
MCGRKQEFLGNLNMWAGKKTRPIMPILNSAQRVMPASTETLVNPLAATSNPTPGRQSTRGRRPSPAYPPLESHRV